MNDKQLRTFLRVAESKSFSKAESQLFLTRQAIQKQITSLEAELGESLFFSSRSGSILTPFGEFFYPYARKILLEHDNAIRDCTQYIRNGISLRIGSPLERTPQIFDVILKEFKKAYPASKVDMRYVPFKDKIELLKNDSEDIVVDFTGKVWNDEQFDVFELSQAPYKCFVNESSDLANKEEILLEDLKGRTVALWYPGHKDLYNTLSSSNLNINIIQVEKNNIMSVMSTCYNGDIFISKSDFFQEDVSFKRIPFDANYMQTIGLIFKTPASIPVKNFLEIATKCKIEEAGK